jgi:hypothetical protein
MCRKNVLTIVMVVVFAMVVGQVQAQMQAITVPNSDFELIYKPGSTTITGVISSGGWTQGVGSDCPIDSGTYNFSDASSGTLADIPGWLGYDRDGWIAKGGTYGRDQTTGNLQGSVAAQGSIADIHSYLSNGGGWGNSAGGLIVSKASLGTIAGNTSYLLSMQCVGDAGPKVLNLLANGVVITPTSSVEPDPEAPDYGDLTEISRTYDVADLTGYIGQSMTIVLGVGRPDPDGAFGAQTKFDSVSLSSEFAFGPTGLIPANGQNVPATFNLLQWTLPDPAEETGTVTCDVWFSDNFPEYGVSDPNFSKYATKIVNNQEVESKSITIADLKTYYWRIDLYDNSNPDPQPFLGMVYTFNTKNVPPVVDAGEADDTWLTDGTVDFDLLGELLEDDGRPVPATLEWTVTGEPSPGAATIITDPTKPGITVTATQTGTYELTLTADDTVYTGSDTVLVLVYNDWCDALRATGSLVPHATDLNGDCITDMRDFAILAGEFLLKINDVVPVVGLVPNGDFETIYKPGSTVITGVLSEAAWTQGVGINCPIDSGSGTYNFSDTTSGTVADIPGWVGYDLAGWQAFGGSYGRDPNFPDRQGSVSNQANHTDGEEAANCYLANGGGWGNSSGGLIISKNSVATVAADTAYVISMFAKGVEGNEAPLVLDLLANGVKVTPDSSGNPVLLTDLWREYTRTYSADTMSAYEGQALKIVVGLGRPLPDGAVGAQLQLDDVAIQAF